MLRNRVLQSFKSLHRTRKNVFKGDPVALEQSRRKINEEYKKNWDTSNESEVLKMVKLAEEVELELRTTVIQAVETEPGKFEAKINENTLKLDNVPFKETCEYTKGKKGKKR